MTQLTKFHSLFVPLTDSELALFEDDPESSFAELQVPSDCGNPAPEYGQVTRVLAPEEQLPPLDSKEWELLF